MKVGIQITKGNKMKQVNRDCRFFGVYGKTFLPDFSGSKKKANQHFNLRHHFSIFSSQLKSQLTWIGCEQNEKYQSDLKLFTDLPTYIHIVVRKSNLFLSNSTWTCFFQCFSTFFLIFFTRIFLFFQFSKHYKKRLF